MAQGLLIPGNISKDFLHWMDLRNEKNELHSKGQRLPAFCI